jgi:hypothetical protein
VSTYSGPYPGYKGAHGKTKGVAKANREQKRIDAEARDRELPQDSLKRRRNRDAIQESAREADTSG